MAKIYLDYNVYINILKAHNKGFPSVLGKFKQSNDDFFFSNGHSEELSKLKEYDHLADLVDEISNKNSLRMNTIEVVKCKESIYVSIDRCLKDDTHAEMRTRAASKLAKETAWRRKWSIERSREFARINQPSIDKEKIWKQQLVIDSLKNEALDDLKVQFKHLLSLLGVFDLPEIDQISFDTFKNDGMKGYRFNFKEVVIDLLSAVLSSVGYGYDKDLATSESGIYDTTHMIMARTCDIFISTDGNFVKKAEAIYEFLGVRTKVIQMPQCIIASGDFTNEDKVIKFVDSILTYPVVKSVIPVSKPKPKTKKLKKKNVVRFKFKNNTKKKRKRKFRKKYGHAQGLAGLKR